MMGTDLLSHRGAVDSGDRSAHRVCVRDPKGLMQHMAGSYSPDFTVLRSGEPEYDRARWVFNPAGIPAPAEAVIARTVNEVRSAVRYAAAVGRPVRALSTGHGSLSRGAMGDALLIRVAIADYGLTALHGSSPTVGAVTDRVTTTGRPRRGPGTQPIRTTPDGWANIITEFVVQERFDTVNFLPEIPDPDHVSRFANEVIPRTATALTHTTHYAG